ncbi:uridine kinase [Paenilisteria rocourtiae]|uniref:Uridine kinase n=1 Tax=Listeria rocourtiae TaxID=647910 RepID=A0A4R6ZMN9_9LIST|nr:uridine kinase [Listeria rocourtiae]EUJ51614.1 uridine/cytidine kinase [Listeria rocourtiae FSL F6-920]MBC1434481.1 uridine kinase [Listeria rocourtiae]MBC1603859.1 uridine kinase [Listeria rocourtiae]TDR53635.1 uridine kinase [Listeria rocourtiae]
MKKKPIVVGVTGGSGSGKTSVSKAIYEHFTGHSILMLEQDFYYKDQAEMAFEERLKTNYDHPLAFDTELLIRHLKQLLRYEPIDKPVYDYELYTRSTEIIHQEPREVIILEGILILEDSKLRDLMDIKVYVDTDDDIRILRRMVRDVNERGRTMESVIDQYLNVVKPMYQKFIEPTKKYADIIIPEGGENKVAIDLMTTKVATILEMKR